MKNRIFVLFLALVIVAAPSVVAAQVDLGYLQNIINSLRQQVNVATQARLQVAVPALSTATGDADLTVTLQQKINDLRSQILQTLNNQRVTGQTQSTPLALPDQREPNTSPTPSGEQGATFCDLMSQMCWAQVQSNHQACLGGCFDRRPNEGPSLPPGFVSCVNQCNATRDRQGQFCSELKTFCEGFFQ